MFRTFSGTTADQVWQNIASAFTREITPAQQSRIGLTHEILHTAISIAHPRERWVISREPPINPAFAIVEVVWIMSGRKDSGFLNYFNRRLPEFAGHESTYYGAYGDRLRNSLGIDQLERAYKALKANPTTRQVVLQIWDAKLDLPSDDGMPRSADVPCNIVSLLKLREGKLEWMQIMRSNDLFRGLPYNIVQFTSLQEVLAGWLEVDVGSYCQISDSLHVYEKDYQAVKKFVPMQASPNTDTLSVPKAESEKLFSELSQRIDLFINENISKPEHLRLSVWAQASPAFQNMLRVVSAEAARRRNWPDEAQSIMDECTNPTFVQSWNRWVNRVAGNISGKTTV